MTIRSEGIVEGEGERRLHPWSWLFVLVQQLKSFALPLLVLLFTGRGNSWELWGLIGAGVLVVLSLAQYFTYRFRVDADGLVVRSGVFQRSVRHIPYQRVQNVVLHQTLLHRLFGVAEVRLESAAGGARPEAEMRVLSMADAHAMEVLVRSHARGGVESAVDGAAVATESTVLLELPTSEVVRLGLISNRGMLLVAAAFGLLAQGGGDVMDDTVGAAAKGLLGWGRELHLGWLGWALGAAAMLGIAVVALRILSVVLALLNFHGFTLRESGRRLSVQRGLLNRMRGNMPRQRIQAWTMREGLTHRWLGRRGLRVDTATAENTGDQRSMRDLAPVIEPAAADRLVRHLMPGIAWPPAHWQPLHPRAWRRQFGAPALVVTIAGAALAWLHGPIGFTAWALVPLLALRARVWAKHAAYSVEDGLVAMREGWLDRHWRFAEIAKLQALSLIRSPFDRRYGMSTLLLDTAGASASDPPLRIRYLPEAEARALHDRLADEMDRAVIPARTAG